MPYGLAIAYTGKFGLAPRCRGGVGSSLDNALLMPPSHNWDGGLFLRNPGKRSRLWIYLALPSQGYA